MKWTVLNAFGGLTWLAGLSFAKGATLPDGGLFSVGDHRLLVGICFGLAGLSVLLWTNLRSTV
jgi:hypothetical protein